MELHELVKRRGDLCLDIMKCLTEEVIAIKLAGENMIECATNIKGQGYSLFIRAREEFLAKIDGLEEQLRISANINTNTH